MTNAAKKAEEGRKAWEEERRKNEESELSFVRKLVNFVRMWRHCENRACRRRRTCTDARACQTKHADAILEWQRTVYIPYLRERFPTVQWGAPAGVMQPQLEAALAAEEEENAKREGRAPAEDLSSRAGKPANVPRHPAYDPGDW
jgi:hypothetical protein